MWNRKFSAESVQGCFLLTRRKRVWQFCHKFFAQNPESLKTSFFPFFPKTFSSTLESRYGNPVEIVFSTVRKTSFKYPKKIICIFFKNFSEIIRWIRRMQIWQPFRFSSAESQKVFPSKVRELWYNVFFFRKWFVCTRRILFVYFCRKFFLDSPKNFRLKSKKTVDLFYYYFFRNVLLDK